MGLNPESNVNSDILNNYQFSCCSALPTLSFPIAIICSIAAITRLPCAAEGSHEITQTGYPKEWGCLSSPWSPQFFRYPQQIPQRTFKKTSISIYPKALCYLCSIIFSSVQLLSHVWLCDPMNCSTPGFPVHYQRPELTQTHVHWVSDTIQPSYSLSSPSLPAFNLSQHQGLFQGVSSLHQVAKVLEFQLQISPSNEYSGLISFSLGRLIWQATFPSLPL